MMDARNLAVALGGEWRAGSGSASCPVCQPERRRDQRGLSISYGSGGRLLMHCHKSGCRFRDIAVAAGICGASLARPGPEDRRRAEAEQREKATKRDRQARAIWNEALPIVGTPAEANLRGRQITCALPSSLRFHPDCWHGPTARRHPALVALVEGGNGFGVHRTYLRSDGRGKASVEPAKAMLGSCTGGAVRLSAAPGPLVVCEGIETGLSLLSGRLAKPAATWAALSTSGMKSLHLPCNAGALIVASDGDDPGRDAASHLAERAHRQGWRVSLWPAPSGMDWNDVLRAMGVVR